MRRRGPSKKLAPVLLAALLPWWGCAAHPGTSRSTTAPAAPVVSGTGPVPSTHPPRRDLSESEARVRELEQQLADRDRQITAVRTAIDVAHGPPDAHAVSAPGPAPAPSQSPAQSQPAAQPEPGSAPQQAAGAAPQHDHAAEPPSAAEPPATAAAPSTEPSRAAEVQVGAAAEQRLADAQKRIAKLQRQLVVEVKRRQEVEAEMTRLLQETSAGPFEHGDDVVEQHLRDELGRARKEISDLRGTLTGERRERDDLERRYAALQAQVQSTATAAARDPASSEEMEALKERQRRVLASIQQDLAASKQRESELRQAMEQSQGGDAVSVADAVTNLRSENSALQMRLDEEHRRNGDLSAKLQLATRVTDLIFKMQSSGAQAAHPVRAIPVSDAR